MPPRPRNSHLLDQVQLGDEIEVWWPHDARYYSGVVGCKLPSGRHRILYNDGEVEDLRLATEQWRFIGAAAQRVLAAQSTPPPLDLPSPGAHSENSPIQPTIPPQLPQDSRRSESTSTVKTPSAKKRTKSKGRKSGSSKPTTPKLSRPKKLSASPSQNTNDSLKAIPASSTSPTPQASATKVKKRQRSSSSTLQIEKQRTADEAISSQHPPFLDDDSCLIDAAPLDTSATNNESASASQPTVSPKLPTSSVVAPAVKSSETIDVLQTKTSTNRQTSAQVAPVIPTKSAKKTVPLSASNEMGNTHNVAENAGCPPVASNDLPSVDHRASTRLVSNKQSSRRKASCPSLDAQKNSMQANVTTPSRTQQQPSGVGNRDKRTIKPLAGNATSKKDGASTALVQKEGLRGSQPSDSKHVQTSASRPTPPALSSAPKLSSSANSIEATPSFTKGHAGRNPVPKAPVPLASSEKDVHASANKNQSVGTADKRASCPAPTKLSGVSERDGDTKSEPGKQEALKDKAKAKEPPTSVHGRCAEGGPASETKSGTVVPAVVMIARVAGKSEQRRLTAGAIGKGPSSRHDDSRSDPLPVNSKGAVYPKKKIDGLVRRISRQNAEAKGASKAKGGNLTKLSVAKRAISKPAKSVLLKQAKATAPPRAHSEPADRRAAAVNPDDGSDIIADVSVPRKPRKGPSSPLLRSTLSGVRRPISSAGDAGQMPSVIGPKATKGVDLQNFSLQQALTRDLSLRGVPSPLVKGEGAGSKLGPFQPTKRRSETLRQSPVSRPEQRSSTDSLSKSADSKDPHQSPKQDKKQRLAPLSKSSPAGAQLDGVAVPSLPQSVPGRTSQLTGQARKTSSILDSEQPVSGTKRTLASEAEKGDHSMGPAGENELHSGYQKKASGETAKNLCAKEKSKVADTLGRLSDAHEASQRDEQQQGRVHSDEDGSIRASTSQAPPLTSTHNAATEMPRNIGIKRTASEKVLEGKRRKLDSRKEDLGQAEKAATSVTGDDDSHAPKTLPQSSPPGYQEETIEQQERLASKENSDPAKCNALSIAAHTANTAQTRQPPSGFSEGDRRESQTGTEKAEKAKTTAVGYQRSDSSLNQLESSGRDDADMGTELRTSEEVQNGPVDCLVTQGTDRSKILESAPAAFSATRAAVSTAALLSPQSGSTRDLSTARGVVAARFSAHQSGTNMRSLETDTQEAAPAVEEVASKEIAGYHSGRENQEVQKRPHPPPTDPQPTVSREVQLQSMMDTGSGEPNERPALVVPRSFARVRFRQSTGSAPDNGNSRSTAFVAQDLDNGPLESLMRAVAEGNRNSLQSRLAPLSSRFENFFADNERFMRSLQCQINKATRTMDSLREELLGVRSAVSDIPSIAEIKEFLEKHAQDTKRAMTQEMRNATSEVKEDLRDYLRRELESAMKNIAAQIQRDSVMLISKAIDTAMSSGLLQDHPRIPDDVGDVVENESGEEIQKGRNEANSKRDVAKHAVADSDEVPLAHRFGLKVFSLKDRPSTMSDTASAGVTPVRGHSQQRPRVSLGNSVHRCVERNARSHEGGNDCRKLMEVENAANESGQKTYTPPQVSATPTVPTGAHSSEAVHLRDEAMKVPQGAGPRDVSRDIAMNSMGAGASLIPTSPPNGLQASMKGGTSHQTYEETSVLDKKEQQNATLKPTPRPARRESYEQLTHQVRILLASCAVEWCLSGGCRDFAPANERTTSVSVEWVKRSVQRCLDGILKRLEDEETFEGAMRDLADSVGPGIQTDWLLQGPTVSNINKARENYAEWDPQLYDFEWESEKRVLASLSEELIRSERSLVGTGEILEDLRHTAMRCVRHASRRKASC